MNEYEARLRTVSSRLIELRGVTGATTSSLFLGLLAVLLSKNKITQKDLDIIFETEFQSAHGTMKDLFEKSYGDADFPLTNEGEIEDVMKQYREYLDKNKHFVMQAAKDADLRSSKRKKTKKPESKPELLNEESKAPVGKPKRPELHFIKEGEDPRKSRGE